MITVFHGRNLLAKGLSWHCTVQLRGRGNTVKSNYTSYPLQCVYSQIFCSTGLLGFQALQINCHLWVVVKMSASVGGVGCKLLLCHLADITI